MRSHCYLLAIIRAWFEIWVHYAYNEPKINFLNQLGSVLQQYEVGLYSVNSDIQWVYSTSQLQNGALRKPNRVTVHSGLVGFQMNQTLKLGANLG